MAQLQAKLDDGKARAALYNSREELFEWGITEYPQLGELNRRLEVHLNLWTTAVSFQRSFPVWMDGPFLELSPEQARPNPSSGPTPSPSPNPNPNPTPNPNPNLNPNPSPNPQPEPGPGS